MKKETAFGVFTQDQSGLWHYDFLELGHIHKALDDAVAHRPLGAAWFWFNGTPAPIHADDTGAELEKRWDEWRRSYQTGAKELLDCLQGQYESPRA